MKKRLISALLTFPLVLNFAFAETYFAQEKDMAKKLLAQATLSAKKGTKETEAILIKKSDDIKFVLYRDAFGSETGDLLISGVKANPLHSFTSDYNFALSVDQEEKISGAEATSFYQLLSDSPYRVYRFEKFNESKSESKLDLSLPTHAQVTIILFSQNQEGTRVFPQAFSLTQCGKAVKEKKSNGTAKIYYAQENSKCPLLYTYTKGEKITGDFNFFIIINNAEKMVKDQIVRSRDVITRYKRLLKNEKSKTKPDASKVAEFTAKISSQELELRRLKQFLRGVSE